MTTRSDLSIRCANCCRALWLRGLALTSLLALTTPAGVNAQWIQDGAQVATGPVAQTDNEITTDGTNGAIVTWVEGDVRVQRIDDGGFTQWTGGGVVLSSGLGSSPAPQIVSDGSGGAIVVWRQGFSIIFAQRVNASGNPLWSAGGVAVDSTGRYDGGVQSIPFSVVVTDGAGGAILTYRDGDIMTAQRITAAGALPWGTEGIMVSPNNGVRPTLVSDGAGGAVVAWEHFPGSFFSDVYAQRLNASGVLQWASGGVPVAVEAMYQELIEITSDGTGGAIMTWADTRGGFPGKTFTQRVDGTGNPVWTTNGVQLPFFSLPVHDGAGGAVLVGTLLNADFDIVAQRIGATGSLLWPATVLICGAAATQTSPQSVATAAGEVAVAWVDFRNGGQDIFASYLDTTGTVRGSPDGDSLCTATGAQFNPRLVSAGPSGAIVSWTDQRTDNDVYAQLYGAIPTAIGPPAGAAPSLQLDNYPNPFNPSTVITYVVPTHGKVRLVIYDAGGRRVATLVDGFQSTGPKRVEWNHGATRNVASGVYFAELVVNGRSAKRKLVLLK